MYRIVALFMAGSVLLGWLPVAQAQEYGAPTEYVTWTATADPATATPGDTVRVTLTAQIDDGWKMYALNSPRPSRAVRVHFDELPAGLIPPDTMYQAGEREAFDPFFEKDVVYFNNAATVWGHLAVTDDAVNGPQRLAVVVNFQICDIRICLPPWNDSLSVGLTIAGAQKEGVSGSASLSPAPPSFAPDGSVLEPEAAPPTASSDFDAARAGGMWGFLLLAIGAGLAALLTPCVFPMIPLTVSFFTKHADDQGAAVRMALVYGLAIILTFTGLGVLMAVLVGAAGAQSFAANPWVNLFIGIIFVVFALSLLGLFELRLPSGLVNFFNRKSTEKQGYLGVLFMGFTLTLVSFSCTAPFVGGLLAATTQGAWSYPILGMVVFSATFSLPFMLFAMFPRALGALPQSGSWMNAVKVVLGFVELAAALKFLSNADLVWGWGLISRTLAIALIVVLFFLAGLYLLGKLPLKHEPMPASIGVGRLLFAIAFFGLSLYLMPGLLGAPLNAIDAYLPPRQADDVSLVHLLGGQQGAVGSEEGWLVDDVDAAFAASEAEGKPVFIDFTGYTCTNCRQMEATVFTRPEIAERFQRDFVLLRLYTDGPRDLEFQQYQLDLTGTVALPTYAIVSPFSREHPLVKVSGTMPAERFAAFLDQGTTAFLQNVAAVQ